MTKKLDEYYYYQKPKPKLKLAKDIKKIIFTLEMAQKPNFSTVCLKILEISPENINYLEKNLKQHRKMSCKHKKDKHSFNINYKRDFLTLLVVRRHFETLDLTDSKKVLKQKMLDLVFKYFSILVFNPFTLLFKIVN